MCATVNTYLALKLRGGFSELDLFAVGHGGVQAAAELSFTFLIFYLHIRKTTTVLIKPIVWNDERTPTCT